jgi:hypothetical protein
MGTGIKERWKRGAKKEGDVLVGDKTTSGSENDYYGKNWTQLEGTVGSSMN